MADATLKDVIDRLKREGQLTRNSSTGHSIRTVKEVLAEQHGQDRTLLQDMKDAFASISRSESGVESEETETTNPSGQTKGDIEERQRETDDFNSSLLEAQLENNKLMTDLISVMKKGNKGGNNIGLFGRVLGGAAAGLALGAGGIAALGLGIGAFFVGLQASDLAIGFFDTPPNYDNIIAGAKAVGQIFKELDAQTIVSVGSLLLAGGFAGLFGKFAGFSVAGGMTAIAMGIGGFFAGFQLAEKGLTWLGVVDKLDSLKAAARGVGDFFSEFIKHENALEMAGVMLGGAGFAALFGVGKSVSAAIGMTLIGAGIAGFFASFVGLDALSGALGANGSNLGPMMENIAKGLTAFFSMPAAAIAGLFVAGGLFGYAPGLGVKAGVGLAIVGAGLGAFFAGFGAADAVAGLLRSDGSTMASLMTNMATGLSALAEVDGMALLGTAGAMLAMGPAMLAFLGAKGLLGVADSFAAIKDFVGGLFGAEEGKSLFEKVADSLNAFEDVDGKNLQHIADSVQPLIDYAHALEYFEGMNVDQITEKLKDLGLVMGDINKLMIALYEGGEIVDGVFKGVTVKVGLKDVPTEEIEAKLKPIAVALDIDTSSLDGKVLTIGAELAGQLNDVVVENNVTGDATETSTNLVIPEELRTLDNPYIPDTDEMKENSTQGTPPNFKLETPPPVFDGLKVESPKVEIHAPNLTPPTDIEAPQASKREIQNMVLGQQQQELATTTSNNNINVIDAKQTAVTTNSSSSSTTNLIGSRGSSMNGSAPSWRIG